MIKVLFVCLGNICRSPLAEAIFNHKIKLLHWQNKFYVDSCGTGDYHIGEQPDHRTVAVSGKHNIPIHHACRQLISEDLLEFDYLLAMDASNHRNIINLTSDTRSREKVLLMRSFDSSDNFNEVPDPYHGTKEFEEVYQILDRSLEGFISFLRQQHRL